MNKFDTAFDVLVKSEGGYVNDPNDPGGETKFGISKRAYPKLDILRLTLEEAKEIYKRDYWDKVSGDALPWPLAMYVFDSAVNQGPVVAIRVLQEALRVPADGILGPATLAAVAAQGKRVGGLYMAARAVRYAKTMNFDIYGKGWMNRLFDVFERGVTNG